MSAASRVPEGLLFALTVFAPFAFGCVEPWSRALLLLLTLMLALSCFARGRRACGAAAWAWLVPAAFAAFGALQTLHPAAPDGPRPAVPSTVAPHETAQAVQLWLCWAALLWSVPRVIQTHGAARRYLRLLFGVGLSLAALGMLQAATGGGMFWAREVKHANFFATYYNRDHAANVLMLSLGAGLGLLLARARRGPVSETPEALRLSVALHAAGALFLLAAIAYCGARGAVLAMPLTAAALGLLGAPGARDARARRAWATAALGLLAVVLALGYRFVSASADAGALVDRAVAGRLAIYEDAWSWWRDAPFFGAGLGSFRVLYPAYQDFELRNVVDHAHSDWIELALDAGAAGLLLGLLSFSALALLAARAWRRARSSEMRALIAGALAAVLGFGFHCLVDFPFQIPGNAALFFSLAGFLLSAPAWGDKQPAFPPSERPEWWETAGVAACLLLLAGAVARPALAAREASIAGLPARRAVAMLQAYSRDDDPRYLRGAAAGLFAAAGGREPSTLRAALGPALSAAEVRPFEPGTQELMARSLLALGRPDDAAGYIARVRLLRFPEIKARDPRPSPEAPVKHLERARALGITVPAGERR